VDEGIKIFRERILKALDKKTIHKPSKKPRRRKK
jgi:hypothetical protein